MHRLIFFPFFHIRQQWYKNNNNYNNTLPVECMYLVINNSLSRGKNTTKKTVCIKKIVFLFSFLFDFSKMATMYVGFSLFGTSPNALVSVWGWWDRYWCEKDSGKNYERIYEFSSFRLHKIFVKFGTQTTFVGVFPSINTNGNGMKFSLSNIIIVIINALELWTNWLLWYLHYNSKLFPSRLVATTTAYIHSKIRL